VPGQVSQGAGSLENLRQQARRVAEEHHLLDDPVTVGAATDNSGRLVRPEGEREVMLEAQFRGERGLAFTADPASFSGRLAELLGLPLDSDQSRALVLAGAKSVLRYLERRGAGPPDRVTLCAAEIAEAIAREFGRAKVGVVGYDSSVVDACVELVSAERVRIADPNPAQVGRERQGVVVVALDGFTDDLFDWADVVIITGESGDRAMAAQWLALADQHGTATIMYNSLGSGRAYFEGLRRAQARANGNGVRSRNGQ